MKQVIYIGAPVGFVAAQTVLQGCAEVHEVPAETEAVSNALRTASAMLDASMKIEITKEMIQQAPDLRIISCATTGSNHIDHEASQVAGVAVRTLREDKALLMNITPAAELSWALLMACARRLPAAVSHVQEGLWVREDFPGLMLNGRRLGLVGCGRIGGWMARYAQAFGLEVIGYDPHLESFPDSIRQTDLAEVMATSDFISVHVHLCEETTGLLSRERLASVKPGAILVNTSRGAVLDEQALLEGLESGRIGAAGLDVLVGEPEISNHPLVNYARTHSNLLITPHCGGFSPDAVAVVCTRAAEKILNSLTEEA